MISSHSKDLNYFTMARYKEIEHLGDNIQGIYIARLRGSDGMEDHCVVLTKQWIFDSNFANALPRSFDLLHLCCSSDESQCLCTGFPQIAHFPKAITKMT